MCDDPGHVHAAVANVAPRSESAVEIADPITLAPVEALTLTTLVDNLSDLLLPDQGPVTRRGCYAPAPRRGWQRACSKARRHSTCRSPSTGSRCW
jgi:7,8-dihydropterin-6-yl-methyl-4-(beta-D-ribofuranosyl)aminobenzene 5'-phosphate synthase